MARVGLRSESYERCQQRKANGTAGPVHLLNGHTDGQRGGPVGDSPLVM